MERIVVSLLLIIPLVSAQKSQLRSFFYKSYEEQKTWVEAQALCRQEHMDLITIHDKEQNDLVTGIYGLRWIGLYRDNMVSPWKWSRGDEAATYFHWDPQEPNNLNVEFCGILKNNGLWHNYRCGKNFTYLCSRENLVLVKENKTWEEALDHCRSLGGENPQYPLSDTKRTLYDLVTLISEDDHNYAREKAQEATTKEVWTGLRFLGDTWLWMGGEAVEYKNVPPCPDSQCGVLEKDSNKSFGTRHCSERRNFLCYSRN